MKTLLAVLLLAPVLALAKPHPIALTFNNVSLVDFSEGTFKAILNRDFVVSPDALASDRRITIRVKAIEYDEVPRFVEDLLAREGIQTTLRNGIYYLTTKQGPADSPKGQHEQKSGEDGTNQSKTSDVSGSYGDSRAIDGGQVHSEQIRRGDEDSELFEPQHRSSEFLANVITAGFGPRSATVAGGRIVLTGSKVSLSKMRALAMSLDSPAKMVDVSASWVEVARNSGQSRGISLAATVLGARFGASLGTANAGAAISLRNTHFELVIDALNSDGRFKQVSSSRIAGEDREKLNLTVGDETPTVSSSGSDNAGNRVQNIVYRPSGVIIEVVPKVLGNGRLKMDIDAQISSFKATANGVAASPTLIKRQVKTKVEMNDGEVMLLGGLEDSQATDATSSLAFLPAAWSIKTDSKVQTDLVLVVSAKVISE